MISNPLVVITGRQPNAKHSSICPTTTGNEVPPMNDEGQPQEDDTIPSGYYEPELSADTMAYIPPRHKFLVASNGDTELLEAMIQRQFIILAGVYLLIQFSTLYHLLSLQFCTGLLCLQYYSRGGGVSGGFGAFGRDRLYKILYTTAVFRRFLLCLWSMFYVTTMWMFINLSGEHPWHCDGFTGNATHRYVYCFIILLCLWYMSTACYSYNSTLHVSFFLWYYRMIITIGGRRKIMWFKYGSRKFGVCLRHLDCVIISKQGAGVEGGIEHCIEGAEHSWIWAFDVCLRWFPWCWVGRVGHSCVSTILLLLVEQVVVCIYRVVFLKEEVRVDVP